MTRECMPILFTLNSRNPNHSCNLAPSISYSGGGGGGAGPPQIIQILGLGEARTLRPTPQQFQFAKSFYPHKNHKHGSRASRTSHTRHQPFKVPHARAVRLRVFIEVCAKLGHKPSGHKRYVLYSGIIIAKHPSAQTSDTCPKPGLQVLLSKSQGPSYLRAWLVCLTITSPRYSPHKLMYLHNPCLEGPYILLGHKDS